MVISLDLGEEMFVHAIVLALDLYTQTQLQRVDFYIGSASVYTSNPVCPGGPHTVGGNYGAEVWCNQPGRYVTVLADLSSLNGSTFEVSICNLGVFGTKFERDIAPVLRFLVDIGVGARNIAEVASNAPMLFQHSVQVRSKYA